MTFKEFLATDEGLLLPDKPSVPGRPRINTSPFPRSWYKPQRPTGTPPPTIKGVKNNINPVKAPQPFRPGVSVLSTTPQPPLPWAVSLFPNAVEPA